MTPAELLDAGYDDGFGVTSLDTLLCYEMTRPQREDFAAFLIGLFGVELNPPPKEGGAKGEKPLQKSPSPLGENDAEQASRSDAAGSATTD